MNPTSAVPSASDNSRRRILCVDDERMMLSMLKAVLKAYDVETAGSPEEALTLIDGRGPFELVISDESMPGMRGLDLLSEVAGRVPSTARILLSGLLSAEARAAEEQGKVFRVLQKPCRREVLIGAVDAALAAARTAAS